MIVSQHVIFPYYASNAEYIIRVHTTHNTTTIEFINFSIILTRYTFGILLVLLWIRFGWIFNGAGNNSLCILWVRCGNQVVLLMEFARLLPLSVALSPSNNEMYRFTFMFAATKQILLMDTHVVDYTKRRTCLQYVRQRWEIISFSIPLSVLLKPSYLKYVQSLM